LKSPGRWAAVLSLVLLAAAGSAVPAVGQPATTDPTPSVPGPRGPIEIRDGQLLAQDRLTLPAVTPFTVPAGAWALDASALWSNSFSWTQDVPGEEPEERRFLIDGETLTLAADIRRGLTPALDVGVRIPLRHRGGGALDGFIDAWHRLFNLEDAARPQFLKNAFRVEGQTIAGSTFDWTGAAGTGLGDVELSTRWRALDHGPGRPSLALVGRLSLPTSTGVFEGGGLGFGGQLVTAIPLGRSTDLYAGLGFTVQGRGPVRSVEYAPARGHAFAAFEWRPWRPVSLIVETNAATRLVDNIRSYPGLHWLVNVEGRFDVGRHTRLDVGLTENLLDQQSTTDLAFYFAFEWRP